MPFNPFPSIPSVLASTVGENFSANAETFILGRKLYAKESVQNFKGDGIVPERNQDISNIGARSNSKIAIPGTATSLGNGMHLFPDVEYGYTSFSTLNRKLTKYTTNVVHIAEPKQVGDLSQALDEILRMQIKKQIPALQPASIHKSIGKPIGHFNGGQVSWGNWNSL